MPSLRVATANAASGRDRRGATGAAQWETWARAAAGLDVDVLAVQEVDHLLPRSGATDQTAVLAGVLGDGWEARFAAAVHGTPGTAAGFRPAVATHPTEPSYGVALASRQPVSHWAELRLDPSRARLPVRAGSRLLWVPDEPRVALAAVVETGDGPVTVVTTHLSFSPVRAARQLREVVRWAATMPGPRVLLGDLNLPRRLAVPVSGWTPAASTPTFPAASPRVQLDHVLVAGPQTPETPETPTSRRATAHRLADSDHLALRVELDLSRPGRSGRAPSP